MMNHTGIKHYIYRRMGIEDDLSQQMFVDKQAHNDEANAASYRGSGNGSWLVSVGQSLLLSLFL